MQGAPLQRYIRCIPTPTMSTRPGRRPTANEDHRHQDGRHRLSRAATLVRIDTDVGLSGFGEANPDAGAAAIVGLIGELKSEFIGEDPRNVEALWEKVRRKHVFSGAQSASS